MWLEFRRVLFRSNQWLEESGRTEIFINSEIEEIKNIVITNLKNDFLDATFYNKETLEDFIRQYVEEADESISEKQRKEHENHQAEKFQQKNQPFNTLRKVLKKG